RLFREKQAPDEVHKWLARIGTWKVARLLVEVDLATSVAAARRLILQGGVRIEGEKVAQPDAEIEISTQQEFLIQVGKRRFVRVSGR
ncbi:MAG: tyrosine--tRNA ligase, partial [Acidobacteria bacterium]|nr:tyrosine--tRNA ligase [Acidobacteriota bacterium]